MHSVLQKNDLTQDYSPKMNTQNISGFSFFSHGEFSLCRKIYDFMRYNKEHIYLSSPSYAYDDIFIKRLSSFLKSPKSHIVILKKPQKTTDHFISKLIHILGVAEEENPIKAMMREIHHLYKNNHKIIFILSGIDHFSEHDVAAIRDFCDTISEKYPTEHNNFFRFIFVGASHEYALYKKFQNQDVKLFETVALKTKDYKNFLAVQNNETLNAQDYMPTAKNLEHISVQSFAAFRKIIPIFKMAAPESDAIKREKNHHFLTEITTGDLSHTEKEMFFKAQEKASKKFYQPQNYNLIFLVKAAFIILCLLGSAFIWHMINGF